MNCPDCQSTALIKRGRKDDYQRYSCRDYGRYCTDKPAKFSAQTKAMAVDMYMNSMGIRSIGRVLKASPAAVLNWIRQEHELMQQRLAQTEPVRAGQPDIIKMDEIYTIVKKKRSGR